MAKKAKAETVEVAPQEVAVKTAPKPTKESWEIKDRMYYLRGNKTPLTHTIPGKHTRKTLFFLFFKKQVHKKKLDMLQIKTHLLLMNNTESVLWGILYLEMVNL